MDETQANGTQAGEAQWGEAEADDTLDDETLEDGDGSDGPNVEKLRRLRLSGFLRELVRVEGKMEAAELLGVNYKTLARAEKSGEITGRMGDALERLLSTGEDPEAAKLRGARRCAGRGRGRASQGDAGRPRRGQGRRRRRQGRR